MTRFFDDGALDRLGRRGAVEAMRRFLLAVAAGEADTPPRAAVEAGGRHHVFTVGADRSAGVAGYRYYSVGAGRGAGVTQVLVLIDTESGEVRAVAAGNAYGAWRTAALGAVAMAEGTRPLGRPIRAAVLGAGFQAHHHARTWAAAAEVERFAVWARRAGAAREFAASLAADTGVEAVACESARDAADAADAVLAVTASAEPVVADDALPRSGYVATVGPKFGGRNELPPGTFERAALLVTDAPDQARSLEAEVGPLPGNRRATDLVPLASLVAGTAAAPADGLTLFVSEGISGSEVALLAAVLEVSD
jgi:ornithine cyclodeaminase/alanine dehydrogenase-like protein (mu-crystallin family)